MLVKSKVLIIDASESTRTFMRFILNNSGYRVTVVKNGAKAMEEIEDQNFDVFLIDLRLPDMEGLELIREIRAISAFEHTPILAVTQFFNKDSHEEEEKAGVTHWITQPVAPQKLIEIVTQISPAPEEFDDEMVNQLINEQK